MKILSILLALGFLPLLWGEDNLTFDMAARKARSLTIAEVLKDAKALERGDIPVLITGYIAYRSSTDYDEFLLMEEGGKSILIDVDEDLQYIFDFQEAIDSKALVSVIGEVDVDRLGKKVDVDFIRLASES